MKKKFTWVAIAAVCFAAPISAFAFDEHNGISFNMTQKEVEKKGFVCNPSEGYPNIKAKCQHMDLTGVAFGYPTKDYKVSIGTSGKVDIISADFSGQLKTSNFFDIRGKIKHFFPTKNEEATFNYQGVSREEWRSKDNAAAVLVLMPGTPPFSETSLSITFRSPRYKAP